MAPKPKFADGEKVLCFHGPLLYEARCRKSQVRDRSIKYFIHYFGWSSNWDEWVPENRVLKINEASMQKQKELLLKKDNTKKAKKNLKGNTKKEPSDKDSPTLPSQERGTKRYADAVASPAPSSGSESLADAQRKIRTRAEQSIEEDEWGNKKKNIKVKFPERLRHVIVDDFELIVNQKKLLQLPAPMSISTILSEYSQLKMSQKGLSSSKKEDIAGLVEGIKEYFNLMHQKLFLYSFEKLQYKQVMAENPGKSASDIYGAHHALRLLTRIGNDIAYVPLDKNTNTCYVKHFSDFAKYLAKNNSLFNIEEYYSASADYIKNAS